MQSELRKKLVKDFADLVVGEPLGFTSKQRQQDSIVFSKPSTRAGRYWLIALSPTTKQQNFFQVELSSHEEPAFPWRGQLPICPSEATGEAGERFCLTYFAAEHESAWYLYDHEASLHEDLLAWLDEPDPNAALAAMDAASLKEGLRRLPGVLATVRDLLVREALPFLERLDGGVDLRG